MSTKPLETLIHVETQDEVSIALWKIYRDDSDLQKSVFLTHGTFSDRRVCMGIASFLVEQGYTCWIMEWRGHGASEMPIEKFNFESIAKLDISAALAYLRNEVQIRKIDCITHSGGGICLSMCLVENPSYQEFISSISLFGCQAFGAAHNMRNRARIFFGKYLSAAMGYVPGQKLGRPHDESYYTMKQWYNWNLSGNFLGDSGKNYEEHLSKIDIPILSVCCKGDDVIAPREGCERFLQAFQNPKNRLLYCSKSEGYLEDYDHSRILHSSSSKKEIWPQVLDWIERPR